MTLSRRDIVLIAVSALALFFFGVVWYFSAPPVDFQAGNIVVITEGASVRDVAQELVDAHVIAFTMPLRILLRISGVEGSVQAGAYRFETPQNLFTIARRLVTGAYGFPPVRITFVEGVSIREMGEQVAEAFPTISPEEFSKTAKPYEGYLFPDTYLFPPSTDAAAIVQAMRTNFDAKLAPLSAEVSASGHSLADCITMASLIEKEVRTTANRRIVAGILWDRLSIGMPLQVDAVFGYIFDRNTYSPSFADLKVDSPYNTYTHKGLPPGPINNPGLDAIEAALNPTKTKYLYYLTDKEGVMHYAVTYAEHQANQRKYLK